MEYKDFFTFSLACITTFIGQWVFINGEIWLLPKATKFKIILRKYKGCLSDLEIDFANKEIKRDVKKSVLRIKNPKIRNMILYIRVNCELEMPGFRWIQIAPFIKHKNNLLFIRYKGPYRFSRYLSKLLAIIYLCMGLFCGYSIVIKN